MINVTNLSVRRSQRVIVDEVTFNVDAGDLHVIAGPNGSGKSTIIAALAGDLLQDPGTISISGHISLSGSALADLDVLEQAKRRAVLTQTPVLFPYTARQLIALSDRQRQRLRLPAPRQQVNVDDLQDRDITTLSGGERARVMLAATLAQGAPALLLDEPTAAFDRSYRDRFVDWVAEWRSDGYGIVLVTHDEKLEQLATSVTELA